MSSSTTTNNTSSSNPTEPEPWIAGNPAHAAEAAQRLDVWPLDAANAALLNEVHPRQYTVSPNVGVGNDNNNSSTIVYDLIAIGSGAGGLVSSKQSARRGALSALVSAHLAGGDCLNVGCVPSKAILRAAKSIAEVKRCAEFGVILPSSSTGGDTPFQIDFGRIMQRLREKRLAIAPADGHAGTVAAGAHVYQGFGTFTGPHTLQVESTVGDGSSSTMKKTTTTLTFKKAVIASGGRPSVPNVPGLATAPYTTNEILFNLEVLPPRMVILGAGVIALEMAQSFAIFGSRVTVLMRSDKLFASKQGDAEAATILQAELEKSGVTFVVGTPTQVTTLRERSVEDPKQLPLLRIAVATKNDDGIDTTMDLECECLLVATGRVANVEKLNLEAAGVEYKVGAGVQVNDLAQTTNPDIYAVGDCVAGVPRLTHMSGEMAKLVVQNSLFADNWKLSSLVVPAVAYTEPEYATVGLSSEAMAEKAGVAVDTYRAGLEHNDRAILESSNTGFCKIFCKRGTDEIVGCTIVAERAGEMINEVSLAMKNSLGLRAIGRNIHSYPTTGEAVMGCGVSFINQNWERLNDK